MSTLVTRCPTCKRSVTWGEQSPFRPFCSDRCRLIDLGAWFSEGRAIAGPDVGAEGDQEPRAFTDDEDGRKG
jgi:uncharacterized protein